MPPAYSRPFRQGHKNDFRDAHAVAEAVERPSTRCVPIKTETGFAGVTSRAVSPDQQSDGCDQSDSRLSIGARHPGPEGASLPTKAAATASGHAHRCAIAPNDQDHRGPYGGGFLRARKPAEKVWRGSTGGARRTRIQHSPFCGKLTAGQVLVLLCLMCRKPSRACCGPHVRSAIAPHPRDAPARAEEMVVTSWSPSTHDRQN